MNEWHTIDHFIDSANVKIFKSQGTALDKFAKKTVKVRVKHNWFDFSNLFNQWISIRLWSLEIQPIQIALF